MTVPRPRSAAGARAEPRARMKGGPGFKFARARVPEPADRGVPWALPGARGADVAEARLRIVGVAGESQHFFLAQGSAHARAVRRHYSLAHPLRVPLRSGRGCRSRSYSLRQSPRRCTIYLDRLVGAALDRRDTGLAVAGARVRILQWSFILSPGSVSGVSCSVILAAAFWPCALPLLGGERLVGWLLELQDKMTGSVTAWW